MRYDELETRVNALILNSQMQPEEDTLQEYGELLNDIAEANALGEITTEEMITLARKFEEV